MNPSRGPSVSGHQFWFCLVDNKQSPQLDYHCLPTSELLARDVRKCREDNFNNLTIFFKEIQTESWFTLSNVSTILEWCWDAGDGNTSPGNVLWQTKYFGKLVNVNLGPHPHPNPCFAKIIPFNMSRPPPHSLKTPPGRSPELGGHFQGREGLILSILIPL